MHPFEKLEYLKSFGGERLTEGLSQKDLHTFLTEDPRLPETIDEAYKKHKELECEYRDLLGESERKQIEDVQKNFLNFYPSATVNPYVALAAHGPWIVTSCGAVIHDSGGYGMLGLGHTPKALMEALSKSQCQANIMTPNFSQKTFIKRLFQEIGHRRARDPKPYGEFLCLNSGSEALTLAARISDIHAKMRTDPRQKYEGRRIKFLALDGAFHGRTDRPSQASSSCLNQYTQKLASYRDRQNLIKVRPNDIEQLTNIFENLADENIFIESRFMEPVMGEGNPGQRISPSFYLAARELTKRHDTLLIVDSVQAGLRTHGVLSIVDYPGFEELPPPDLEAFSKALNGGQFPFSLLAVTTEIAGLFTTGLYGNTMTTNPRALAVAEAVLSSISDDLRQNIVARGKSFLDKFAALQNEFPDIITQVQGTGLLFSVGINPEKAKVVGDNGLESRLRKGGIGVIHGGQNALRFTPNFDISEAEVDLIVRKNRALLEEFNA